MGLLKREKLLKKGQFKIAKVELGDGDYVFVREMSGRERDAWEAKMLEGIPAEKLDAITTGNMGDGLKDFRASLAVRTVCDEQGVLIFKPEDVAELSMNMGAGKLQKIAMEATRLNGISKKAQDDLVKN